MYEQHFGLAQAPFKITPDPQFFFPGGNRGAVLEALVYAVARGEGMVKVVGEVGSGKTMLCRMLERELPQDCEIVYLANPRLSADEILHAVAFELGLDVRPEDTKLKAQHALHAYLLERHAENRRVIIFIEEAQGMPLDSLEEIRMLSNLETSSDKLLQIVLFGQPELDDKLNLHEIRQLRERITHSFNLAPFNREEVRDYVNARTRASGYRGQTLFLPAAIKQLERHSSGLLRRINVLADKALLAAFADHASQVAPKHVRRAAADSEFAALSGTRPWLWAAAVLGVIVVALVWYLSQMQENISLHSNAGGAGPLAPEASAMLQAEHDQALADTEFRTDTSNQPKSASVVGEIVDNHARVPTVSPTTGLVTSAHLRPRPPVLPKGRDESDTVERTRP